MQVITQPLPPSLPVTLVEAAGEFVLIIRDGLLAGDVIEQLATLLAIVPGPWEQERKQQTG